MAVIAGRPTRGALLPPWLVAFSGTRGGALAIFVARRVLWMIPVLWPIDLLELPRRGPSPTLKTETRLTVKLMDDLRVPEGQPLERDPYGLAHRPSAKDARVSIRAWARRLRLARPRVALLGPGQSTNIIPGQQRHSFQPAHHNQEQHETTRQAENHYPL